MKTVNRIVPMLVLAALVLGLPVNGHAFLGGKYETVAPESGAASIPVADVDDGRAHYYRLKQDGKEIRFFVLKSRDGVIRAAFDACDVCFHEGKGYSQDGEFMVCNNCGQRFHSSRINEVKGGCNPSPLRREVDDGQVVINVADILAGAEYF